MHIRRTRLSEYIHHIVVRVWMITFKMEMFDAHSRTLYMIWWMVFSLEKDVKIKFQYRLKQCKSNMRYCKPKKCISISTAYTLNSNIKINFVLFDLVPHHMNFIIVQVLMLISIVLNLTNIDCHWVDWLISKWAGERVFYRTNDWFCPCFKEDKTKSFFFLISDKYLKLLKYKSTKISV